MSYLLDTNAVIALMKQHPAMLAFVRDVGHSELWLCAPVAAELWYGVYKSLRVEENRSRLLSLLTIMPTLPFSDEAARHFGQIRADLSRHGTPIGPYDLQIAAIARAQNFVVVTHNIREFMRVPGLLVRDWQA